MDFETGILATIRGERKIAEEKPENFVRVQIWDAIAQKNGDEPHAKQE